ncbi:MAG: S-methyl-5-thioribose-1-phosphate isomerase [Calditrichaeota bacterium]|nr:MAG: S-methyl-5-thioribose-1-phosphate isomerase [Calditrichota bacterium]
MVVQAVTWEEDHLRMIDQTRLPLETVYLDLYTIEEVFEAIQKLRVRGAPAIGVAAAYGLYLGMRKAPVASPEEFFRQLQQYIDYLSTARPTAVNLFWALRRLQTRLEQLTDPTVEQLKTHLLELAIELHEDDRKRCEGIGHHGQEVVPPGARILTHCNTGALATGGIGTALGVIYRAHELGKGVEVYADETRPVLQGARLTVWELVTAGVPVTLICDNMAASLMQQGKVDLIIVGADRIAADGSVANKIGTYNLAVLARHHNIPFYVAAPLSTFDLSLENGRDIPIEVRDGDEVRRVFQRCLITVPDVPCWNPAFDVTPPELISGIITENGVIFPPYRDNIPQFFNR